MQISDGVKRMKDCKSKIGNKNGNPFRIRTMLKEEGK